MSTIIQTNHLTKSYGQSRGIIEVTFDIQEGEVFGFLGMTGVGIALLVIGLVQFRYADIELG